MSILKTGWDRSKWYAMIKLGIRGSLLFELFVALMILSVGIVSVLRVFGEALAVGRRNIERGQVQVEVRKLLLPWLANPASAFFTENGSITVPLDSGPSHYWCEIHSRPMIFPVDLSKDASKSQGQTPGIAQKPNHYYQVRFHVTRDNGAAVFDLDTVLMR